MKVTMNSNNRMPMLLLFFFVNNFSLFIEFIIKDIEMHKVIWEKIFHFPHDVISPVDTNLNSHSLT